MDQAPDQAAANNREPTVDISSEDSSDDTASNSSSSTDSYMEELMAEERERERQIQRRMGIIWNRPEFTLTQREVVEDFPDAPDGLNSTTHTVVRYTFRNGDIVTGVETQIMEWLRARIRAKAISFILRTEGGRHRIVFQRSNRRPRSEGPVRVIDID